ncbi:hypothetical protein BGW36DRAFT_58070 [Talaromyces proteolyticus]|uniref:Uncharacterized protein n=1 Tax=Talaromyces proteolyticus TaxID=1131652 RepID=A0AAD4KET4_9EURO|nr:uncharacterized protein BGW36DRAFT_58070 [Talaromyces proteolyticus]KAH8690614.1 hypothetical protein BGW36DRAFT_58070 [Talaromyces proteolyticus]
MWQNDNRAADVLPVSKLNFAIAGAFMMSMLLTSVEDDEVDSWLTRIDEYLCLLQAHSVSFDVTKLASIRLELLRKHGRRTSERIATDKVTNGSSSEAVSELVSVSPGVSSNNQIENDIANASDLLDGQSQMMLDPFGDRGDLDWVALLNFE